MARGFYRWYYFEKWRSIMTKAEGLKKVERLVDDFEQNERHYMSK